MTVIFTSCIDFALLAKELIAPIFDPKFRTDFPILVWKTGSRCGENFDENWKTFRSFPSLKIWKGSDKNWGKIMGTIFGFQISDTTCLILKGKDARSV